MENLQNPIFYIFDGQKNGPFNPKFLFFIFPKILGPKWRTVPNLLHFGWNLKHKPPQATDSPHPLTATVKDHTSASDHTSAEFYFKFRSPLKGLIISVKKSFKRRKDYIFWK